jgi:putative SOS response-associated peptidase YedK
MWRQSAEWGPVYSGLMTDCNEAVRLVHNRIAVLLLPDDRDRWLKARSMTQSRFRSVAPDELIQIERSRATDQR